MIRRLLMSSLGLSIFIGYFEVAAQQSANIPRIGVLHAVATHTPSTRAFLEGLRDLGYVEGRTIAIEWRWASGDPSRYRALAAELVRLKVDVIVAAHAETALAAKNASETIPVVMAASFDPVGSGLALTLARPGRNVTGLSLMIPELTPKRLQLIKEAVPRLSCVALLWHPEPLIEALVNDHETAARALGLNPRTFAVRQSDDIERAMQQAAEAQCGAVVTLQQPFWFLHRTSVAKLSLEHRLPALSGEQGFAQVGGLISYGPSLPDSWRRAAAFVDRILRGARPADLPIERPTKFELVINLKTAKALGLTIPDSILVRADEVIE